MCKISGFSGLSISEIEGVEREFEISLPVDYIEFLKTYNGGIPVRNYLTLVIPETDEKIVLGVLLGKNENRNYDLYHWNTEYYDEMIDSTLIIGTEYNSGFIVLINQTDETGVYFWDNAYSLRDSSDESNMYKICESFSQFIDMLTFVD